MNQNESKQDMGHGATMSSFFGIKGKNKCPITDILLFILSFIQPLWCLMWKITMWNNKLRMSVLLGNKYSTQ